MDARAAAAAILPWPLVRRWCAVTSQHRCSAAGHRVAAQGSSNALATVIVVKAAIAVTVVTGTGFAAHHAVVRLGSEANRVGASAAVRSASPTPQATLARDVTLFRSAASRSAA